MSNGVAVDRFETLYHNPDNLHTIMDMTIMEEKEAYRNGIMPCSKCFKQYYCGSELRIQ